MNGATALHTRAACNNCGDVPATREVDGGIIVCERCDTAPAANDDVLGALLSGIIRATPLCSRCCQPAFLRVDETIVLCAECWLKVEVRILADIENDSSFAAATPGVTAAEKPAPAPAAAVTPISRDGASRSPIITTGDCPGTELTASRQNTLEPVRDFEIASHANAHVEARSGMDRQAGLSDGTTAIVAPVAECASRLADGRTSAAAVVPAKPQTSGDDGVTGGESAATNFSSGGGLEDLQDMQSTASARSVSSGDAGERWPGRALQNVHQAPESRETYPITGQKDPIRPDRPEGNGSSARPPRSSTRQDSEAEMLSDVWPRDARASSGRTPPRLFEAPRCDLALPILPRGGASDLEAAGLASGRQDSIATGDSNRPSDVPGLAVVGRDSNSPSASIHPDLPRNLTAHAEGIPGTVCSFSVSDGVPCDALPCRDGETPVMLARAPSESNPDSASASPPATADASSKLATVNPDAVFSSATDLEFETLVSALEVQMGWRAPPNDSNDGASA